MDRIFVTHYNVVFNEYVFTFNYAIKLNHSPNY